jgi:hypothetical protein
MGCDAHSRYPLRMITAAISLFAISSVSGLVVLFAAARRAPVGFEDENGFHVVETATPSVAVFVAPASAN